MDIKSILLKVGKVALKNVVPGAGIVIDAVNEFLPSEKKLSKDATGTETMTAINELPPEKAMEIFSKELDVEIAEEEGFTNRFQAAMEADKTGNTTRPKIALMMAEVTCFEIMVFSIVLCVAIATDRYDMVDTVKATWPLVLTMIATPTALLRSYFAMREREKKARYQMANNQNVSAGNVVESIMNIFKK